MPLHLFVKSYLPKLRAPLAMVLASLLASASSASALTFYVDGASPGASDSGPGSVSVPYKTIKAAVTARGVAGNTILVAPAVYREAVRITASGTAESPIILKASAPGAIVSGADDFASPTKWTLVTGNVYVASSVSWTPLQVFADNARLKPSTASPGDLPARSFRYVSGTGLYVNAGGGNPGDRGCEVGHIKTAIEVRGAFVTVDGMMATRTDGHAVHIKGSNAIMQHCTATFANEYGVKLDASANSLLFRNTVGDNNDDGIHVSGGSTNCLIQANECYRNARPDMRSATGITFHSAPNCIAEGNYCHHNQDSGIHFYTGSNNGVSRNNLCSFNGDHGFDHVASTGVWHINDVAYGNYKDGFSFEGNSPGGKLYNSIGLDNGLTSGEYDLWVDSESLVGFESDYNIFWNSTSQKPVKIASTMYSSVAAYSAAHGRDSHSLQVNALFTNPASGDFRLTSSSPALDNAITSIPNWSVIDFAGRGRHDVASVPNTGAGPIPFADRGALEFAPTEPTTDRFPVVSVASSASGSEGATLTITVSASDPDGQSIASLSANLASLPAGHNATFTKNPLNTSGTLTWTPTFTHGRTSPYVVTFTATNTLSASASTSITIANVDRAPVVTAPATASGPENSALSITVTAADPDGEVITALSANLSDLPAGHNAQFVANGAKTMGTLTWTPTLTDAVRPYRVTFTASNALTGRDTTVVTVIDVDRAPVVTAPATAPAREGQPFTLAVSAADPDGDPIGALSADFSALPAGHAAAFTPNASNTGGTVTWTPSGATPSGPFAIVFHATNSGSGSATTLVRVDDVATVTAETNASVNEGEALNFTITAADADGDPISALTADLSQLPAGHGATFAPNATNTGGTLAWTPAYEDAPGPYAVTFTATSSAAGLPPASATASTSITVNDVDRAPRVTVASNAVVAEGEALSLEVSAADPDGDAIASLAANLSALPLGHDAAFVANETNSAGTLTWTPRPGDGANDPFAVVFTAANALSGDATAVIAVDQAPVVVAPLAATTNEGEAVTIEVTASDPDGDAIASLTADLTGLPAGNDAVFTPNAGNTGGTLAWTPSYDDAGGYSITFTASNGQSVSSTTSFVVTNLDRAPQLSVATVVRPPENVMLTLEVSAQDPDGDAIAELTVDLSALPEGHGATFTPNAGNLGGVLTWMPLTAGAGPYAITFTAANVLSSSASSSIAIDHAPVVSVDPIATVSEREMLSLAVTAADADGDPLTSLTADLAALPAGHDAVFTPNATNTGGTLMWTPTFADAPGPYAVTFHALSSTGLTGVAGTSLVVNPIDAAPIVIAPLAAAVHAGELLSLAVTASDFDGDPITSLAADLSALPPGNDAVFTPNAENTAGTLTWTPAADDGHGPYAITFTASNAASASATTTVIYDRAPVVTVSPAVSGGEGVAIVFDVTAVDPDGDAITQLTAANLPAGATFTPGAGNLGGEFRWTPGVGQGGASAYAVEFTATNALTGSAGTSIAVNARPIAVLVVTPPAGAALLMVTADAGGSSDLDGTIVSYTFDFGDGTSIGPQTFGTAMHSYNAGTYTMTVSVTDDRGATATASQQIVAATLPSNLVGNPGFESDLTGWTRSGSATLARVAGGHGGSWCMEMRATSSSSFGVTDSPNWVALVPAVGTKYRVSAWVRSTAHRGEVKIKVKEYVGSTQYGSTGYSNLVTLSPAWQLLTADFTAVRAGATLDVSVNAYPLVSGEIVQVDDVSITLADGPLPDRAPAVTVAPVATTLEGAPVTVLVTAADPDGHVITSLTANLSSLPAGHNAVFTTNASKTAGTLTWTPTATDGRAAAYDVTFTATNALSGSASTAITVVDLPIGGATNLVGNPGFETNLTGWSKVGSATLARVAGGHSGSWCMEVQAPSSTASYGITDSPNWVASVPAIGTVYRMSAWVRSAAHGGEIKLKVKEYAGSTQVGLTLYSNLVKLSPTWQLITVDFIALRAGSSLDFSVNAYPVVSGERFQVDDLSITRVVNSALPIAQSRSAREFDEPLTFGAWITNPVRAEGALHFTLTEAGPASVEIFDVAGRQVMRPLDEARLSAGRHQLAIRARDGGRRMPAGTYFYRVRAAEGVKTGRFVVLE